MFEDERKVQKVVRFIAADERLGIKHDAVQFIAVEGGNRTVRTSDIVDIS
jgi:hypothetical protein